MVLLCILSGISTLCIHGAFSIKLVIDCDNSVDFDINTLSATFMLHGSHMIGQNMYVYYNGLKPLIRKSKKKKKK